MQRLTCFSKPIAYASGVSIAIATLPLSTWAVSVKDVPNPRQQNNGWVTDMANVFSPQAEAKLNQMIS
ncbi:MAG: TPM domain-containing protein, partial [Acaryochloris sp. SU_5_25]|nr:TPM domain-containing protein [Acaryochloris sp. SU_5_25]